MKKALLALALLAAPRAAHADGDACAAAADEGKRARREGDMPRAHDLFVKCSADRCDAALRRDCAQWAGEVESPPPARGHTALPWIVAGVGGALAVTGAVLFLVTPAQPPNCDAASGACSKKPGESDADLATDRSNANSHENNQKVALILLTAGGFLVVSGILWHFLEPTGPATSRIVTPWIGPHAGGAAAAFSF